MGSNFTMSIAVSALVILALGLPSPAAATCKFPAIFNFGDSNSDTGNLFAMFGYLPPPYGMTFFKKPNGRITDGRLMIDFMADTLELPYLRASLDAVASNFSHGANFATGGSGIMPPNITFHSKGFTPTCIQHQFQQFKDLKARSKEIRSQGGVYSELLPKDEDFKSALYTIDIGSNDMGLIFYGNMSVDVAKAYMPSVIEQLKTAIRNIYAEEGRYFWIHNTGPIGCLPKYIENLPKDAPKDKVGCGSDINEISQYFNTELKKAVEELRKNMTSAVFTLVDVYTVKYDLISKAKEYGFEDPLKACKGMEVYRGEACEKPSTWVNWDGLHFTEAANKWVFDKIVDGSYSDPPKTPLKEACQKK